MNNMVTEIVGNEIGNVLNEIQKTNDTIEEVSVKTTGLETSIANLESKDTELETSINSLEENKQNKTRLNASFFYLLFKIESETCFVVVFFISVQQHAFQM